MGETLRLLARDKVALAAALFLLLVLACAVFGPVVLGEAADKMNLRQRNAPPFSLADGWLYVLGADALGRSILARIVVAARDTVTIATLAVALSLVAGGTIGLVAGYARGWTETVIMRFADILMSFPSLLLAVVVLYVFNPGVATVVAVLAITRLPIYIRTIRAEVLEIRERLFVQAARVLGAGPVRLIGRHIAPVTVPTLITIATLDFAFVMLAESALS